MKRLSLIPIIIACACSLICHAQDDSEKQPGKYVIRTEIVEHPVLSKVFPGVIFEKEILGGTAPPRKRVVARLGNEKMFMPHYFNVVYASVCERSDASINEILEAYARLAYWKWDPDLKILTVEKVKIERKFYTIDYRMVVDLIWDPNGIERQERNELLFSIEDKEIKWVEVWKDGREIFEFTPALLDCSDDLILEISGMVQTLHNDEDGTDHHYVKVSENGQPTNHYVDFKISGFNRL